MSSDSPKKDGKVNLLLVDDRPDKLIALESVLSELDENVLVASSGADALRVLLRHDVAVILLDVNMPIMDGFETASLIRQRQNLEHTPIIFISGINVNENHVSRGYSLGAVDYILSPVVPEVLKAKVSVFIELYRSREQVRRQGALLLEAAEKRAAGLESRLENLLNQLNLGVFSCSSDGKIIEANPAFLNILGIDHPAETPPAIIERLFAMQNPDAAGRGNGDGGGQSIETRLEDGSTRWFSLSARGTLSGTGPSRTEGLLEDITSRKSAEEELKEADRRKDGFLAILSHELRNPLAALQSALELSDRLGDGRNERWTREILTRQVRHLGRLTDDLLDIARITHDKVELKLTEFDLSAALHRAVELVRPAIEAQAHSLTVSIAPGLPMLGDATRIEQSIANLLQNAAKYTPAGGVITLAAVREGSEATISVIDTGIGIAPEMLPKVFDPFIQSDSSLDRSQGGLGIGLTLVRRLVEMHKGRVTAASGGPGAGSEFIVRLPLLERLTAPARSDTPPARLHRGLGKVLVVDDNLDSAMLLAALLRMSGYIVSTAHDGIAAVEAARRERPEVVLLDIGLPGMNGYEVAKTLRENPPIPNLFLVAISGYGQKSDIDRAMHAGFDHHMVKPVEFDSLSAVLQERESSNGHPVRLDSGSTSSAPSLPA